MKGYVTMSDPLPLDGTQLLIVEIPPPPPPPEEYLRAQVREAHTILSRLHTSFGMQLPNNVYMAMAYLQIEIVNGGNHAQGK